MFSVKKITLSYTGEELGQEVVAVATHWKTAAGLARDLRNTIDADALRSVCRFEAVSQKTGKVSAEFWNYRIMKGATGSTYCITPHLCEALRGVTHDLTAEETAVCQDIVEKLVAPYREAAPRKETAREEARRILAEVEAEEAAEAAAAEAEGRYVQAEDPCDTRAKTAVSQMQRLGEEQLGNRVGCEEAVETASRKGMGNAIRAVRQAATNYVFVHEMAALLLLIQKINGYKFGWTLKQADLLDEEFGDVRKFATRMEIQFCNFKNGRK